MESLIKTPSYIVAFRDQRTGRLFERSRGRMITAGPAPFCRVVRGGGGCCLVESESHESGNECTRDPGFQCGRPFLNANVVTCTYQHT